MKLLKSLAAAAAMVALSGTAQAALDSLGDGTVRDTNTNLIWLQNWNVNGAQNWSTQKGWADSLDFASSTDWRLPEISEYGALFTAYGNLTQVAEFTNVQPGGYWSGTEFNPGFSARFFLPPFGSQSSESQVGQFFAVAVRPGNVAAIPEPQTYALLLAGLGAVVVAVRRRRPV